MNIETYKKHAISWISMLVLPAFLIACNAQNHLSTQTENWVRVNASASVPAVPDKLSLKVYVEEKNNSVSQAKRIVDLNTDKILKRWINLGIKNSQVSSFDLSIQPVYEYDKDTRKQIQDGFVVSRTLSVEIKNWDTFDQLIDSALALGATRVGNVQADVSNHQNLYNQALAAAVEQARFKAQILAESAGGKLGRAMQITEQGGYRPYAVAEMKLMRSDSASQPGTTDVNASVEVVFRLQ
ncbi:SIMPL domain-containing protein [Catenovulum sp. SX2]|uniref:SIMPL domain-containing protein n=1 Tax=Catenovulum sp. SX2 TaxID=3398614 RepID=UPI003F863614